jgi:hypothetical protein
MVVTHKVKSGIMVTKKCTKCGVVKPLDDFYRNKNKPNDHRELSCKVCMNKQQRKHRAQSEVKAQIRKYRAQPEVKKRAREYWQENKLAAFERIGGVRCVLCGCTESIFLSVDHTNKNGNKHRKQERSAQKITQWILTATDVELHKWNLRVLCHNCNTATRDISNKEIQAAIKRERVRIRNQPTDKG